MKTNKKDCLQIWFLCSGFLYYPGIYLALGSECLFLILPTFSRSDVDQGLWLGLEKRQEYLQFKRLDSHFFTFSAWKLSTLTVKNIFLLLFQS